MSDTLDPDRGSRVSGLPGALRGRFILSARHNHLVSDGRTSQGAPGEAISAGELLLASLVSCGLGLVQAKALEEGIAGLDVSLEAEFLRDPEEPTRFAALTLAFTFRGVAPDLAERSVAHFTGKCPIYNTLKRGGEISVSITHA